MNTTTFTTVLFVAALISAAVTCESEGPRSAASTRVTQDLSDEAAIDRYERLLRANPNDHTARDNLKKLIDRPDPISDELGRRVRDILRAYARAETITVVNKDEPGERLSVSGTVKSEDGKPIAGAVLYVFHTDANGSYTRAAVMNEPNARLFAFLKTDKEGRFKFNTIRPGGYPGRPDRQGEKWRIPQHIHFQVTAPGYHERKFQMVFEDDSRMTPYWHDWATRGNHIVVKVSRDAHGVQYAECDIVVQHDSAANNPAVLKVDNRRSRSTQPADDSRPSLR